MKAKLCSPNMDTSVRGISQLKNKPAVPNTILTIWRFGDYIGIWRWDPWQDQHWVMVNIFVHEDQTTQTITSTNLPEALVIKRRLEQRRPATGIHENRYAYRNIRSKWTMSDLPLPKSYQRLLIKSLFETALKTGFI